MKSLTPSLPKALEADLRNRGALSGPRPELLDFALLLVEEYVRYPADNLDSTWMPLNYCMLPHAVAAGPLREALKALVAVVC